MRVYVVVTGGYEESWIEGVYLSRESAENRRARVQRNRTCEGRVRYNGEVHDYALGVWTDIREWDVRDARGGKA